VDFERQVIIVNIIVNSTNFLIGLVPYDPNRVLSHLDLQLKTPTPPPVETQTWTSKTPQNAKEVEFQTTHLKNRIVRHQDSSPTSIHEAFDQLAKGAQIMAHSFILLKAEVKALQEANALKKKRASKRKRRIHLGGSLTIEEGQELVRNTQTQEEEEGGDVVRAKRVKGQPRRCGLCNKVGHNARTCEEVLDSITINS
jgi:hypothetical protein